MVRVCHRERIPFVARGSGTGLSGGALPVAGGIVICLARMKRILEVDLPNARVVVEPGVINLRRYGTCRAGRSISMRPIRRRNRCAASEATSRRTPEARTA